MVAPARHRHSYAEYVELDDLSNVKLEYFCGEIYAMAGGTPDHASLAMNMGIALAPLRDRGCRLFSSDLRIRAGELAAYPDLTVTCAPLEHDPESRTTVLNPSIIVEVLSDSTQDYDRSDKAEHYRAIPSLVAYVLVAHDRPHIEVWRKDASEAWSHREYGPGATLELEGVRVLVDDVYRDTSLAAR